MFRCFEIVQENNVLWVISGLYKTASSSFFKQHHLSHSLPSTVIFSAFSTLNLPREVYFQFQTKMSISLKTLKLYGKGSVNPPKVALILTLLDVPFETISVPMAKVKEPEYTAINPNGRLPSIFDPNTNLTLWESGAIIEYLIEKYDVERKFSFVSGSNESYLAKQWLFFQTTGQGPYFGQAAVFKMFHHEKLPSAVERYVKASPTATSSLEST